MRLIASATAVVLAVGLLSACEPGGDKPPSPQPKHSTHHPKRVKPSATCHGEDAPDQSWTSSPNPDLKREYRVYNCYAV